MAIVSSGLLSHSLKAQHSVEPPCSESRRSNVEVDEVNEVDEVVGVVEGRR